jgi:hypothetical protein
LDTGETGVKMALMTVNNHDEQGGERDYRAQPRWSAGKTSRRTTGG